MHSRRGLSALAVGGAVWWASAGCHHHATPVHVPAPLPAYATEEAVAIGPAPTGATIPTVIEAAAEPAVTLPDAVQACVLANLKIQAGKEKVQQAHGDLIVDSTIPNPSLFVDGQLLPLQNVNFENQAGPPQYDAQLTIPIDWWLFGKRIAAIEAARWNIDVANADTADLIRRQTSLTVETFYDVLESRALVKLSEETLRDVQQIEEITKKQVELGGAGTIELDRVRLAVLDARRDLRLKQENSSVAKAKLRTLIGRARANDDFEVEGTLQVTAVAAPPSLDEAFALAQQHRPDLISDRYAVNQAQAALERERRRARPLVSVTPGYSYQDQRWVTGFRNANLYSIALTTTLPITDRNQGAIAKAESAIRQTQLNLLSDQAEIRTEIETALAAYRRAFDNIQREDPATVQAARNLRDKTEAAFKVGGRKLLELLDAQRAYRERVQASITSQADYWRSLSRLNAAIGMKVIEPNQPTQPEEKKQP
jgi:cobalt-zinc-cadmium efflux system outer membrane protein